MDKKIITISRRFGAGGRELGKRLAKELDFPYYDKELINKAARESGLTRGFLENYDEKSVNSFLYTLATTPQFMGDTVGTNWGDMAAKATQEAIIDAAKESCVIVGRNADYILREMPDLFRIFVTAQDEQRVQHIVKRDGLSKEEAEKKMRRMDRARAANYNYYTNQKWGQADYYDLCLNLSTIRIEKAVEIILSAIKF